MRTLTYKFFRKIDAGLLYFSSRFFFLTEIYEFIPLIVLTLLNCRVGRSHLPVQKCILFPEKNNEKETLNCIISVNSPGGYNGGKLFREIKNTTKCITVSHLSLSTELNGDAENVKS